MAGGGFNLRLGFCQVRSVEEGVQGSQALCRRVHVTVDHVIDARQGAGGRKEMRDGRRLWGSVDSRNCWSWGAQCGVLDVVIGEAAVVVTSRCKAVLSNSGGKGAVCNFPYSNSHIFKKQGEGNMRNFSVSLYLTCYISNM